MYTTKKQSSVEVQAGMKSVMFVTLIPLCLAAGCGPSVNGRSAGPQEVAADDRAVDESEVTAASTTVAFRRGVAPSASYQGVADVSLYERTPTTAAGAGTSLMADVDYPESSGLGATALLRFDVTAIPPGSTITAASLTLNVTNPSSGAAFVIAPLTRPWTESQATWTQAASGQRWGAPGALDPSDRGGTPLASFLPKATGTHVVPFNAAGLATLRAWVNAPSLNFGVVVDPVNNMDGLGFSSSEAATLGDRPALTVTYTPAISTGKGLLGQYYAGTAFDTLLATRTDAMVDFSWAGAAPAVGVPATDFSVRWTGQVEPLYSETYTFSTLSDDGIRVWVNGQKLIDHWNNHPAAVDSGSLTLTVRQKYELKVEYFQGVGSTKAQLSWASPSQPAQVIPKSQLYPAASNLAPKALFTWLPNALSPAFDAAASTDADGTILTYAWDFGDGQTATGKAVSHTYATAGTYAVKLTVTDNLGATGATTQTLSATDRENLVAGTYVPGLKDDTVGVPNVSLITKVEVGTVQPTSSGAYTDFPRYVVSGAPTITDTRFEAPVFLGSTTTGDVTFKRCHFVGLNPQTVQALYDAAGDTKAVREAASGFVNYTARHATFIDCTFDNGWWYDQGKSNRISTLWSAALHGGNLSLVRSELTRFVDGINFAQGPCGPEAYTLVDSSWIHGGFFANGIVPPPGASWVAQSGNNTHSDAFQFNTGRNVEIRYSLLGGARADFSERVSVPYLPGGSTGDDYANSAIMWQQENNAYGAAGLVDNVDLHDNWMAGAVGTLQIVTKNGNTLPGATNKVRNNRFLRRELGWGTSANSPGYAIVKSSDTGVAFSGNVLWDGTDANRAGTGDVCPMAYW